LIRTERAGSAALDGRGRTTAGWNQHAGATFHDRLTTGFLSMSDTPKLRDQAFDPETIAIMIVAFDDVRGRLGLAPHDDPLAGYVARSVIEMAHRGFAQAEALADAVMQQLEDESVVGASGEGFVEATHHRGAVAPAAE